MRCRRGREAPSIDRTAMPSTTASKNSARARTSRHGSSSPSAAPRSSRTSMSRMRCSTLASRYSLISGSSSGQRRHRPGQHAAGRLARAGEQVGVRPQHGLDRGPGRLARGEEPRGLAGVLGQVEVGGLLEKLGLGPERRVEAGRADAHRRGERADRRALVAAVPEHAQRVTQRLVAVELARSAPGHGRHLSVSIASLSVDSAAAAARSSVSVDTEFVAAAPTSDESERESACEVPES